MTIQKRAWHVKGSLDIPKIRERFVKEGMIALGWTNFKSMAGKDREQIRDMLRDDHCNKHYATNPRSLGIATATLNKFINLMNIGDYILLPYDDKVYFGKVLSDYPCKKKFIAGKDKEFPHRREVEWLLGEKPILKINLPHSVNKRLGYPRVLIEHNYDDIHKIVTSNS